MFRRLRTPSLSTLGWRQLLFDLAHRRYRHRQFITIAYLVLLTVLGVPDRLPVFFWAGSVMVAAGELVRLWASGHVKKDKVLATSGPYAFVRHPLYVGNHTIAIGFCLASALWWSLPVWIGLSLVFYPAAISREDGVLQKNFGSQWEEWCGETRALIPRLTPYRRSGRSEWSLRQSLRVNGEPVIAAFLFSCLYLLYLRVS